MGAGQAVTSPGIEGWRPNLSRDGTKLAFCGHRAGKWELWEKSLVDGREAPIMVDDYTRDLPVWSPDGKRLGYRRTNSRTGESQLMVWSSRSHSEEPLAASSTVRKSVQDWSVDGKWFLATLVNNDTDRVEIWLMPAVATGHAGPQARKIISDPAYDLYQSRFSPDGRWIVFQAVKYSPLESNLYVMPAEPNEETDTFYYLFPLRHDIEILELTTLKALKMWERGKPWLETPQNTLAEAEQLRVQLLVKGQGEG